MYKAIETKNDTEISAQNWEDQKVKVPASEIPSRASLASVVGQKVKFLLGDSIKASHQ